MTGSSDGPQPASSSVIEKIAAGIAAAAAAWTVASTLRVIRAGYSPLPFWDEWDFWNRYLTYHFTPPWFFLQHNEHRLAVPAILFAIDHVLFEARGWFLLACTFCLQGIMAFMLWRLAGQAFRQDRAGAVVLGAAIVSCLYSAQQYANFTWGFQVTFPLLYCAALGAVFALWKGSDAYRRGEPSSAWFAGCLALATAATYCMANGIAIWPVLFLTVLWLRLPRTFGFGVAAAGAVLAVAFFHGWQQVNPTRNPLASLSDARSVIAFWLVHLGSPAAPLGFFAGGTSVSLKCAAVLGGLLMLILTIEFAALWLARDRHNGAQAVVIHTGVLLAGSSLLMAVGRSAMGPLTEAATSRYLSPAYLFFLCVLIAAWPLARRASASALYGGTCAALLLSIAMLQPGALRTVRDRAAAYHLAEAAVVDGVTDPEAWRLVYHTPKTALASVDYLRQHQLAIFAEEWTHWPGIALNRRFRIDSAGNACRGDFDEALVVTSDLRPGWRVSGWAWDVKAGRPPRFVILSDGAGQVAGVGLTGLPEEPEVTALSPRHPASPWSGYVSGEPGTITAYLLESDERSLCAIGSRMVRPMGETVSFANAGAALGDAPIQFTGSWARDGYVPQVGRPPVEGMILSSWAGAGSNTGTLRFGPIHLDGRTNILLPLVTGPASHGLSVVIRDAATGKTLAELAPPPARTDWWAWAPDLPPGEKTIEIVAEDKGRGPGEWQALGWPHVLIKAAAPVPSHLAPAYFLDTIGPVQNPAARGAVRISGQNAVRFSGWAIDQPAKAAAGAVELVVDQETYKARYGVERVDVAQHFNNPAYRSSGFELTIAPGRLSRGPHTVAVRVISRDLKTYCQSVPLRFAIE